MGTAAATTGELADTRPDGELLALVRDGDLDAFGVLYGRHATAAARLARRLAPGPDADDLVADAFDRVLAALRRGGGPEESFRAYLLTALRRLHVDGLRAGARVRATDDLEPHAPGVPFADPAVAGFESSAAARAFASLPERWQLVLWHTEVEGQRPAEVAPLLGLSPNSVAALAYRAREGLRQAFLTMHAQASAEADCGRVVELLGAYVRGGLSRRDEAVVRAHLSECRRCTGIYLEIAEVNAGLGALLAPAVLGGPGAAYVTATLGSGVATATGGLVAPSSVAVLLGQASAAALARGRELLGQAGAATSTGAGAAVAVAVTLAVIGGGVVATQQGDDETPEAPEARGPSETPVAPGGDRGRSRDRSGDTGGGAGRDRGSGGGPGPGGSDDADASALEQAPAPTGSATGSATGPAAPSTTTPGGGEEAAGGGPDGSGDAASDGSGGDGGGDGGGQQPSPPATGGAPPRDVRVRAQAQRDPADFRVSVAVTGLGSGGTARVAFGADQPVAVLHLDRRCDLVAVGRARCHVSGESASLVFRARPLPDRTTRVRFAVTPTGGTADAHPGNESATVSMTGRLAG